MEFAHRIIRQHYLIESHRFWKTEAAPATLVDDDAAAAFGVFVAANLQPNGAVWLMSSTTALALSMRKNALGQKEYPEMTLLGGTFQGLPVIVSQYVGNQLVLVNAPDT